MKSLEEEFSTEQDSRWYPSDLSTLAQCKTGQNGCVLREEKINLEGKSSTMH